MNKTVGRVATTLVATAMLASLAAVPAFAVGDDGDTSGTTGTTVTKLETTGNTVTFKKLIDMKNATGASIPTGDFTFTVGAPSSTTGSDIAGNPSEDITDEDDQTQGTQIVVSSDGTKNELEGTITFKDTAFDAVGTYVYTLQENDGGNPDIDYHESDVYTLRVTVLNASSTNPDGETFVIGDVTLQGENGKTDTITNEYTTYDLTVTKTVTGDWGVASDSFTFDIEFNNVPVSATSFTMGGQEKTFASILNEGKYKTQFTLTGVTGGNSIKFEGLPSGVTYTITEENVGAAAGYQTSAKGTGDTDYTEGKVYNGDMMVSDVAQDITVDYTNTRDPGPATGIVMDVAPYALLVVIAAAGCFVFLRKRRED